MTAAAKPLPASRRNGSSLVADALRHEMTLDPSVIVLGEDVAEMGGVFGATRLLLREFGADRVFDTPISETAFIGTAIGAAQSGLRPVVELMFVDFLGVCFDQIANEMAKHRYMSGGLQTVPAVIRTAVGCIGSAAQHSQVLSATFAHIPGLKVAFPATHADLRGMLLSAIRDDDPVVVLEHKMLLKTRGEALAMAESFPEEPTATPLDGVARRREGSDVTIVAAGWMVQLAFSAAEALEDEGISTGVVDLRSLVPLDRDGLVEAAAATPALLVVDEDYRDYGMSGEVMATLVERLGPAAPALGRHAPSVPVPAAANLEALVVPSVESIASAVRALVGR